MSDAVTELAKAVADAVDSKLKSALAKGSTTTLAEFMGSDAEGKGWVQLVGSDSPTPVRRMTVEASPGDTVSVTIRNGRAVIDSNISNPSAGLSGVKAVDKKATVAKQTAIQAIDYASAAQGAATAAQSSADVAAKKADEATQEAVNAKAGADVANLAALAATQDAALAHSMAESATLSAEIAKEGADNALASAEDALESANVAAYGLSEVEKVVGTVNWIAEHGTYVSAAGTQFDEKNVYYRRVPTTFVLTEDLSVVSGKAYYTRSGDGTDEDPYVYTPVDDPDDSEIGTYYEAVQWRYEKVDNPTEADIDEYYLLSIDESVQNYISMHLALLDDGLHVIGTSDDYSTVLSTDGMDVRNPSGKSVALYGETARIGDVDNIHLLAKSTKISFRSDAGDVAYIGMGEDEVWRLFIDQAEVEDSIRFGNYVWVKRPNGNMTIKYVEGGE